MRVGPGDDVERGPGRQHRQRPRRGCRTGRCGPARRAPGCRAPPAWRSSGGTRARRAGPEGAAGRTGRAPRSPPRRRRCGTRPARRRCARRRPAGPRPGRATTARRAPASQARSSEAGAGPTLLAGHPPRLVDEHHRPAGGHGGVAGGEHVEGPAQPAGTVPEHEEHPAGMPGGRRRRARAPVRAGCRRAGPRRGRSAPGAAARGRSPVAPEDLTGHRVDHADELRRRVRGSSRCGPVGPVAADRPSTPGRP